MIHVTLCVRMIIITFSDVQYGLHTLKGRLMSMYIWLGFGTTLPLSYFLAIPLLCQSCSVWKRKLKIWKSDVRARSVCIRLWMLGNSNGMQLNECIHYINTTYYCSPTVQHVCILGQGGCGTAVASRFLSSDFSKQYICKYMWNVFKSDSKI